MCYVWYFGELTKLRAYSVLCYVFQVSLRITGRHRLDCTHQRKSHVLRILVYYASENGVMFCNSIMNEILSKVFLRIKRLFLNEKLF